MNVKNQLNWYNTYFSLKSGSSLAVKLEKAAQAIWDLYADAANVMISNQENENDNEEDYIYNIKINPKTNKAERFNLYNEEFEPLFQNDIYDLLVVGIADEIIYCEGYELS